MLSLSFVCGRYPHKEQEVCQLRSIPDLGSKLPGFIGAILYSSSTLPALVEYGIENKRGLNRASGAHCARIARSLRALAGVVVLAGRGASAEVRRFYAFLA